MYTIVLYGLLRSLLNLKLRLQAWSNDMLGDMPKAIISGTVLSFFTREYQWVMGETSTGNIIQNTYSESALMNLVKQA